MGLESASVISDLVSSNPLGTDNESQGDDHLRLIKTAIKNTFPNATKPYAFPAASASVVGNLAVNETTHRNMTVPIDALAAQRTVTLPSNPVDGWEGEYLKYDSGSNAVVVTGAQSLNGATSVQLTNQYQGLRVLYKAADSTWTGRFTNPGAGYYVGGPGVSLGDLGAKNTSLRIMAAAASGEAWSGYRLSGVLDFVGTSPGDVLQRGNAGWERLAASTAGMVLKSQGPASPLVMDYPTPPAYVHAATNAIIVHSGAIPLDGTTPQIGEGFPIFSASIVPTRVSSKIRVTVQLYGVPGTSNATWVTSLFKNGAADAVAGTFRFDSGIGSLGNVGQDLPLGHVYETPASALTAISFHVRSGYTNNGNIVLNYTVISTSGISPPRASYITLEEIFQAS